MAHFLSIKPGPVSFPADKLVQRAARKAGRAIVQAAKYVHKATRHAIRISKTISKPGKAPHSRRGVLKNAVASRAWPSRLYAEVGVGTELGAPPRLSAIASIHEGGGTIRIQRQTYRPGQAGPIAAGSADGGNAKDRWLRSKGAIMVRLKTAAQARRAETVMASLRTASAASYPRRPFVRPTLAKCLPRIVKLFHL